MRRTNSKEAMEAIKKAIIESYEAAKEHYTYDGKEAKTEYNDICKDILTAFENEKVKHDCRYKAGRISKYSLFCDWMAGLPTAFPVSDDIFLGSAVDWLAAIFAVSGVLVFVCVGSIPAAVFLFWGKFNIKECAQMNYKKHAKYLLKSIRNAFKISDSLEEYEKICQCIYFSDCQIDYATFRRLKSLVL